MYSFINRLKPAEPLEIDQKRQIRAHVSKSLARQRKLVEETLPSVLETAALDGESAWRQHKLKKRTASRAKSRRNAEPAGKACKPADSVDRSRKGSADLSTSDFGGQQHVINLPVDDEERPAFRKNDILRCNSSQLLGHSHTPEPMLTTWTATSLPMHGDILLRVCAFQMTHFRPDISIEQASAVTGFVWKKSPCTILSYALSLAALGHLQSTTPGSGNDVVNMFKGKVFREMIKYLPSDERSDEMVPSILCLTSFELSRASLEARTHLQALNTIRTLDRQKGNDELPIMFEGLDLMHSIMFDIPTVSKVEQESITDSNNIVNVFTYLTNEQDDATTGIMTRTQLSSYIGEMLSQLALLANNVLHGEEVERSKIDLFFECIEEFRARFCAEEQQGEGEQYIARSFYHSCAILYNVLINRRKMRNPSNKKHVTGIYFATIRNRRFWNACPRLRVWVLAVALSSSRDSGEQSLFQNQLAAIIYRFGAQGWEGVKTFLCSFLAIRSQLDSRAKQASPTKKMAKQSRTILQTASSESAAHCASSTYSGSTSPPPITTPATEQPIDDVPPTNKPQPRFIPLPSKSLTASVIENAKLYPDLNEKYSFMPPVHIPHVMSKGYTYLSQDRKYDSMLLKGESGRMCMIGTTIPDVGWVAMF